MAKLRSTDGRRRSFLSVYDIRDPKDPGVVQLRRYRLVELPAAGVYVHKIMGPDPDRDPHDHPYSFLTLILTGSYTELFGEDGMKRTWRSWSFHRMIAEDPHRIVAVHRVPTWTFVVRWHRRRPWGYRVDGRWVHEKDYHQARADRPSSN